MIRGGEELTLSRDMRGKRPSPVGSLREKETFHPGRRRRRAGTYFLKANQQGWGSARGEVRIRHRDRQRRDAAIAREAA